MEITGVNDGPTAVADSDTTGEDGPALTGGNVLANDTDPDTGDTKTVIGVGAATGNVGTIVTGSNGGDFTIDANGDWSFDPAGAFEDLDDGEDRVTEVSYTMEDSQGATSTTTLSVTVNGANDPATGGTPSAAYTEDDTGRTIDLLAGSNDVDGDALTVNNVTVTAPDSRTVTFSVSPAGVLTLDDGQFEDLDEGDLFELTIDYNINDGTIDTATSASIEITGVNDGPVADPDSVTTDEDTLAAAFNVLDNDSDVDADDTLSVTAVGVGTPSGNVGMAVTGSNGGLFTIGSDGVASFDPNGDFEELEVGEDATTAVSYIVTDSQGATATQTVTATVNGVNDTPEPVNDTASTDEDTPVSIDVLDNDSDPDVQDLTITIDTGPANGTAVVDDNGTPGDLTDDTITYTPDADFNGTDSFTYQVDDGDGGTATATVEVTVNAVNDAPVQNTPPAATFTEDDTGRSIDLLDGASDVDLDDLDVANVIVTASDGRSVSTSVDTETGILSVDDGQFDDLDVGDTVTLDVMYDITDGTLNTTATASIAITGENDDPVIGSPAAFSIAENTTAVGTVTATDLDDASTATFSITGGDDGGLFIIDSGTGALNFAGAPDFELPTDTGGDNGYQVEVTVTDDQLATDVQTITVTVTDANDDPVAVGDSFITVEDSVLTRLPAQLLANDTDQDGDTPVFTGIVTSSGVNGTVAFDGTTITFTPDGDFNGTASFDYTIVDGNGGTDTGTVTVDVLPEPDVPVAGDDSFTTDEDVALIGASVTGNDTDADGDTLNYSLVTGAANGTLTLNGSGTFDYTPNADFNGTDTFTYEVDDGTGLTDTAEVSITVNAINDAPDAVDDTATTDEDVSTTIAALGNDTDPENDTLTVSAFDATSAAGGTITESGGLFTYTPGAEFSGTDTFSYTVTDGDLTDTATVTVTVNAVNDVPVAADDSGTVNEDGSVTIDVLANDTDADGNTDIDPASVLIDDGGSGTTSLSVPGEGTWTVNTTTGAITFSPEPDYDGTVTPVGYSVADLQGARSNTAQVSVTLTPQADAPVIDQADPSTVSVDENTTSVTQITATDPDTGDTQTFSLSGDDSTLFTIDGSGNLSFIDAPDFEIDTSDDGDQVYEVDVIVTDGDGLTDTISVEATVQDANDAPVAADDTVQDMVEDTPFTYPEAVLLAGDTDQDGDALNVTAVSNAVGGVAVLNPSGSVTFTPDAGYNGPASFDYTVSDGNGGSDVGTASFNVDAVPDLPVADDDSITVAEGATGSGNVLANDEDEDGDALSVTQVSGSAGNVATLIAGDNGGQFVVNGDGTFIFDTNGEFTGLDQGDSATTSVTYQLSAGGDTDTATLSVTVTGTATAPVGFPVTYTGIGEDQFFVENIGDGSGGVVGVFFTDEDSPLAPGDIALTSVTFDGVSVPLAGSGVNYNPLTGDLSIDGSGVALFQALDETQTATVVATLTATDTTDGSLTGDSLVTFEIQGVNDAPTITSGDTFTVLENSIAPIFNVTTTDPDDAAPVSYALTGTDQDDFLIDSNGIVTFAASPDFEAPTDADTDNVYEFTVEVSDGTDTTTQAVTVTVADANEQPVQGGDLTATVDEGAAVTLTNADLNATDPENGTRTYFVTAAPLVGVLSNTNTFATGITSFTQADIDSGFIQYVHDGSETTADSFDVELSDGTNTLAPVTFTLDVNPVNDAPDAVDDSYSTGFETTLVVGAASGLLANDTDPEGDTLLAPLFTGNTVNGIYEIQTDGSFTYTPNAGFTGTDTFTYEADDQNGGFDTATVTITVGGAVVPGPGDVVLTGADDVFTTPDTGVNRVIGGDGDDTISTGGGNDILVGGAGADNLFGGAGNDTLIGGTGGGTVNGGAGADLFVYRAADFPTGSFTIAFIDDFTAGEDTLELSGFAGINDASDLTIGDGSGNAVIFLPGGVGAIVFSNFTSVGEVPLGDIDVVTTGTDFEFDVVVTDQTLSEASDSFVSLDSGPNVVDGGDGNDFISTAGGDDTLIGGAGSDALFGRAGEDTLDGGAGNDALTGGLGADTFIFRAADAPSGTLAIDTVTDFEIGIDTLEFNGFAGVTQFSDLTVQDIGADLLVDLGGSRFVRLNGLDDVTDLQASDTLFT
ncbi:Ig-like domain-containing protein [Meridianimarinicoccus roseus]|uniref:Ig-like domain-containing protein n=1 Tax=Meridianimarinicoccus roseus TaxID=2072018 RepID=UPI003082AB6C